MTSLSSWRTAAARDSWLGPAESGGIGWPWSRFHEVMRIWPRLVAFTLMSAVNGQVSKMDRAGHLRTNQTTLDQMWPVSYTHLRAHET